TTLVPLGAAGSFAGRLFYGHRDLLVALGGWLIIALGPAPPPPRPSAVAPCRPPPVAPHARVGAPGGRPAGGRPRLPRRRTGRAPAYLRTSE
ncbi:hypothetical protein ACFV25_22465, partial [Streptomyces sp. NPDC059715]